MFVTRFGYLGVALTVFVESGCRRRLEVIAAAVLIFVVVRLKRKAGRGKRPA
ncbi:hypothetical protein ACIA5C_21800 [Actinoplanes sp. NPDC051343]|uniref:hypothetical protein n=1 Tax=Actinoplanes sp. NPDC051343 TaxID=3363906 RepID=UPI0037B52BD0